nr:MAG TPA: hypothetical protein [Caudoviricetes sp.]
MRNLREKQLKKFYSSLIKIYTSLVGMIQYKYTTIY